MTREAIAQLKARVDQALIDGQHIANAARYIAEIEAQTGLIEPVGYAKGSTGHLLQACEAAFRGQQTKVAAPPAPEPVPEAVEVDGTPEEPLPESLKSGKKKK